MRPGIRFYIIVPFLINIFLFAGGIIYGAHSFSYWLDSLIAKWQWIGWTQYLFWLVFMILVSIVFFAFSLIANLIAAPFNGFLSEAVEKMLSDEKMKVSKERILIQDIFDMFKSEFQKILYFLVRAIPLLILFIVPIVNLIAPVLWFLFSAWILAIEYMNYPFSNHKILFAAQIKKMKKNKQLAFGFGLGVMILTFIPVVNFLVMPISVIGATRIWIDHRNNFCCPS